MAQKKATVHDDTTTGPDPKDNQQASQQESVTELATVVVYITIQEDFLWDLCDNAGKPAHIFQNFPRDGTRHSWHHCTCFVYLPAINSLSSTLWYSISLTCVPTPVLFISQWLINFHQPSHKTLVIYSVT